MIEIKNKKELLALMPDVDNLTKKIYGRVFSNAMSNRFKVYADNSFLFISLDNGNITSNISYTLPPNSIKFTKNIEFTKVTFKETGKTVDILSRNSLDAVLLSTGEIIRGSFGTLQSYINLNKSNVVSVSHYNYLITDAIRSDKNNFKHLNYKDSFSTRNYLCLNDALGLKKGMIVDPYDIYYSNHHKNPLDLFNDKYKIGGLKTNCNLSLVTLEQLESVKEDVFDCDKGRCRCLIYCISKSANESNKTIKSALIRIWKECFETN